MGESNSIVQVRLSRPMSISCCPVKGGGRAKGAVFSPGLPFWLWRTARGRAVFSLRCFGSGEVVKPACSLVRFRGDEAGVVVVAAVDMVAGLLRWWVLGLGGVSRFLSCESGSLGRLVPFDVDVRDGYCGDL